MVMINTKKSETIRKMLIVLYIISIFEVIARSLFGPVFAVYVIHIGGDLLASGTALAINTAVVGLFIFIFGRVASKYHTEKLQLVIGYGLTALVYLGYSFVKTPHQLFLLEAISGVAAALEVPAFSGLFSSLQEKDKHAKGWGDYLGMMNFISAGALVASGAIAQKYGFNPLFYTMFGFEMLCMLFAITLFRYKSVV
jgi:MFS family permease